MEDLQSDPYVMALNSGHSRHRLAIRSFAWPAFSLRNGI